MKANKKHAHLFFAIFFILIIASIIFISADDPPIPHGISGFIFIRTGNLQAPLGSFFKINDTTSGDIIRGKTNIPVPGYTGKYSAIISGNDGDFIIVTAWNNTNYGKTNITLFGDMVGVNVSLNITRPSETNVTIINPSSYTIINAGDNFSINVTIKIIGGSHGVNCNSSINFSKSNIFILMNGESMEHSYGDLPLGMTIYDSWNLSGNRSGLTNITVKSYCASDGENFDNLSSSTIINLRVIEGIAPEINLFSPSNNTLNRTNNNILFTYVVSDSSEIANCSLYLNDILNITNSTTVIKNSLNNFSVFLENSQYNWSIRCFDSDENEGISGIFNLTIEVIFPSFSDFGIDNPINLLVGTTKIVYCNVTVSDEIGSDEISHVNATLFNIGSSGIFMQNDNNNHYTNPNCTMTNSGLTSKNFSCSFYLQYYSNNGSWRCNVTAISINQMTNSSSIDTLVNPLYAIGSESRLDYGIIAPDDLSTEDNNLTIYNFGNQNINISVSGYGFEEGDNYSMVCETGEKISIGFERYSIHPNMNWDEMVNLTSDIMMIDNFTLPPRTNDFAFENDINKTYWKIKVPSGFKSTSCNGTITYFAFS